MAMVDRIERACRDAGTAKTVRLAIIAALREAIPFDGFVFPLTDPGTLVGTAPLADIPGLQWPQLPRLIRNRYLTTVNRWPEIVDSGAVSLLGATRGDPARSLLWRNVLRELGVVDTASIAFTDRYGCWGFLELWRTTSQPFTRTELTALTGVGPLVAAGLRAAVGRTFIEVADDLGRPGPAVILLDPELHVRSQTSAAAEALFRLNPPDEPMSPIPAAAYNIGAALVAAEQGVPVGAPWARVSLGGNRWVTVRADRIGADIGVTIETSTVGERLDLFARAHGLSAREVEVLTLLSAGSDTRAIATTLVISEHTAADHVKALLAKSDARTRQLMLARALGT